MNAVKVETGNAIQGMHVCCAGVLMYFSATLSHRASACSCVVLHDSCTSNLAKVPCVLQETVSLLLRTGQPLLMAL